MTVTLMTEADLAARWCMSAKTLQRWRMNQIGPEYLKLGKHVRYSVHEVELFERQFKSRSDWVVGQLAPEPTKGHKKSIGGRLRRSEFSETRTEAIITAYLEHLFSPDKIPLPTGSMEDYVSLMTLKIASNDPAEGQIEIDKAQLSPEVLFVDLLNTLGKLAGNINSVLNNARRKLTTLDPIALQRAVDQFADMVTRKRIRNWVGKNSD